MKMIYKIKMLSDWHCGTGLTEGADVDLICIKDNYGLPIIPGKTLKGLIKEAANYYKKFSEDKDGWNKFIKESFGEQTDKNSNQSEKGKFYFTNATLSKNIIETLKIDKDKIQTIYRKISSTAIDKKGIADEHSLRKIEVVVPLTLFAQIDGVGNEEIEKLGNCLKLVKRLGTNRNRGLGRCILSQMEVK